MHCNCFLAATEGWRVGHLQAVTQSTSLRAGRFDRYSSPTLRCKQDARTHWCRKITIGLSILPGS